MTDTAKLRAGIRTKGDLSATVVKVSDVVVDETESLMRQAADEIEELRRVAIATRQLVAKIKVIHDNSEYQSVWVMSHNHGMPYGGPNYADELKALEKLL